MRLLLGILLLVSLAGCATAPRKRPTGVPPDATAAAGRYHEVKKGQTLWSISKMYDVTLEEIIRSNRLPDASKIEVGQLIFISRAPGNAPSKTGRAVNIKEKNTEGFIWPVKGVVVSYFGSLRNLAKNKGIDIETREGSDVLASASGRVTFCSNNLKGYGKTIIIEHAGGFQTVYAHNAQNLVDVDQNVKQGAVIAKVGKTGRVEKPTLHFEIRKEHNPQNPFYFLP
ncbi:MAG: hypothetical protein A2Z72_04015 [Omnitrophica bacterium RBG_13_46_9]|nr:MAG: hypothetical protein A2Z72_04015 [Omnitrophica bacterium RBG_13_46_9]